GRAARRIGYPRAMVAGHDSTASAGGVAAAACLDGLRRKALTAPGRNRAVPVMGARAVYSPALRGGATGAGVAQLGGGLPPWAREWVRITTDRKMDLNRISGQTQRNSRRCCTPTCAVRHAVSVPAPRAVRCKPPRWSTRPI